MDQLWRENELKLLIENFSESTPEELQKLFPNRKMSGILIKAHRLKLKRPKITFKINSENTKGIKNPMFGKNSASD